MNSANTSPEKIAVENLQLSMKALGYLKRLQINTIADLLDYTQEDLITLDEECGREVIQALQTHLHLTLPLNDIDER
jgi:DNA-directed RNA polymerase alpha subunit